MTFLANQAFPNYIIDFMSIRGSIQGTYVGSDTLKLENVQLPKLPPELVDVFNVNDWFRVYINGVYIPKDIAEAYDEFIHLSPDESIAQFKLMDEVIAAKKLHFGIGRWMIVNWSFYEGSRLSHVLREAGLLHPDDMAGVLIRVFHRKLNGNPENLENLVSEYKAIRVEEQKKMGSIHFDKTNK